MIFLSSDPNAELVEIEYFIDKKLARTNVTLEQWNRHFHDHKEEIATGRVQVLDVPPEKAKEIAEAASQTDGIIFHLWPVGAKVPNGDVMFPTAVSHKPVEKLEIPKIRRGRPLLAYDDLDVAAPCVHALEHRTPAAAGDGQIDANIAYLHSTDLEPVDALRQCHPVEGDSASPTVYPEPQGSLEQQEHTPGRPRLRLAGHRVRDGAMMSRP